MTQAKLFNEYEGDKEDYEEDFVVPKKPGEAPDGGWGWVVVIGAFLVSLCVEGLLFSYITIRPAIAEYYHVEESSIQMVGNLMAVFALLGGPLASALTEKYGCRIVTCAGALVTSVSLLASMGMPNIVALHITYGVCAGLGLSMTYLPSIVIVSKWFEHKRAFATGLAVQGAGVGVLIFPPIYKGLLDGHDWKNVTLIIAGLFLNCLVAGCLFRSLTHAKTKGMKRGKIQHGAIMKALIAEKERQRTISNGSLDNCIITRDNKLIKIDRIDLRNKSNSYINKLKETFGFSSRSLNRSKNSLVVPKVVVDSIYKPHKASPIPLNKMLITKPSSTPPTPKRDSGCGGSLDSPNFKSRSYEALAGDDPWDKDANLVVSLPSQNKELTSASDKNVHYLDSTASSRMNQGADWEAAFGSLSNNASPMGSGPSININVRPSGSKMSSVMTVPGGQSEMETIYEEEEEYTDCRLCRKACVMFDLMLLKSPTFLVLLLCSFCTMIAAIIPFLHLPVKASSLGISMDNSLFLISIVWVANMIGRVIVGWIADRPWASAVYLNSTLLTLAGILSFFCSEFVNNGWLSMYAAFFGFFTAPFMALRSIMLIELFGKDRLTCSFGLLMCGQGLGLFTGYQLSDILEGDMPFYVVGALMVLAGVLGFGLKRLKIFEDRPDLRIVNIEELAEPERIIVENCESVI